MIITAILDFIFNGVIVLFTLFPTAKIADIPVIGVQLNVILVYAVGLFHSFMILFPFARIVWTCFLWILVFEGLLLGIKFILGSRVPANTD